MWTLLSFSFWNPRTEAVDGGDAERVCDFELGGDGAVEWRDFATAPFQCRKDFDPHGNEGNTEELPEVREEVVVEVGNGGGAGRREPETVSECDGLDNVFCYEGGFVETENAGAVGGAEFGEDDDGELEWV